MYLNKPTFLSDAPDVSGSSPHTTIVNENAVLTLHCYILGFPIQKIMWLLNGSGKFTKNMAVSVANRKQLSSVLSVMTWSSVSHATSHGSYSCIATNHLGMANRSFEVTVAREYGLRYMKRFHE